MKTDIFISYRSKNYGALAARAICERFLNLGYQVFLDKSSLRNGTFTTQLENAIREADDMILILPRDCFVSEKDKGEDMAVFVEEIKTALSLNKNIIPVLMEGFQWDSSLPEEIREVQIKEGTVLNTELFDGMIEKIISLLNAEPVKMPKMRRTDDDREPVNTVRNICYDNLPAEVQNTLDSIRPLFQGSPYFTEEESIETKLGQQEFYLSFPEEQMSKMAFSKCVFSGRDINIDHFLDRMGITPEQKTLFLNRLDIARDKTAQEFIQRNDGNLFNGTMFGIYSGDSLSRTSDQEESPILHLDLFKTDYFTHRTMLNLYSECREDERFISFRDEKDNLNKLSMFRTSLGISLIAEVPKENCIIMTKRSKKAAYSDGKTWIYPSMTETVSSSDYNKYSEGVEINSCVFRGLLEELGMTTKYYDIHSIKFHSMFYETFFTQDNMTASVKLKDFVSTDMIRSLQGKDRELEVDDLLFVPLDKESIKQFITENLESFRPQALYTLLEYLNRKEILIDWS